ncbi:MAG: beta-glycosidase [Prevotellaceae bacterium]|nr:beta-glycosidase [Prevotellaceae bacterium]
MKKGLFTILLIFISLNIVAGNGKRHTINLSGQWQFALDEDSTGLSKGFLFSNFDDSVMLPGTTDTNRKGHPLTKKNETTHLSRLYSYIGKAWYKRDVIIPKEWKDKDIYLHLERTKSSKIYIDGVYAGSNNDVSTPQIYNLTAFLRPGKHTVTIIIDNAKGIPNQLLTASHAFTEDTQTNWNGIIGDIFLECVNPVHIDNIMMSSRTEPITFQYSILGKTKKKISLTEVITDVSTGEKVYEKQHKVDIRKTSTITSIVPNDVYEKLKRWDEFEPNIYKFTVYIDNGDSICKTFGKIDFKTKGNFFYVNGNKTFLRGKHDACVFPLTAHVPMDTDSWRRYFSTLKQYGINHVRFHSWCPPEACFEVADEMGFYLQPELPFWGDFNDKDPYLMSFLHKEGLNILGKYGHHPSFVMMALGNELWGSIPNMQEFVRDFRMADSTKLYTLGSNYYLGYKEPMPEMDYFTTCRIGGEAWGKYNTHVRGSFSFADAYDGGLINHEYPNTITTFEKAIERTSIPVISHETGQFQVYPDYREISKYTGVLYPYNMEIFKKRLENSCMSDLANQFHKASGLWSVLLYKADIEMDLRTKNMAGFQLLDIQDYPGQGSAYVGILDAFMESKNIVSPAEWRQWCSPVVPLFETHKMCYTDGDTISGNIMIAAYDNGKSDLKQLKWKLLDTNNNIRTEGILPINAKNGNGLIEVGQICIKAKLADKSINERMNLILSIDGTSYHNSYPLWIYRNNDFHKDIKELSRNILITDSMTSEVVEKLNNGAKVLLMPNDSIYKQQTVGALFQTDYWNYRMFKTICQNNKKAISPGTLGMLIDNTHPLFMNFPTEIHTNWQWAAIVKHSNPFILDNTQDNYRPIIQVIDNVERNHKLGLVFEFTVGKGKLLVCMSDLNKAMTNQYPEVNQFYISLLEYMNSTDFSPATSLTVDKLNALLTEKVSEENINELRNISFE